MATETSSDTLHSASQPLSNASRRFAEDVKQVATEQAGAAWDEAKETARAKLHEQQRLAASGVGDFATALRKAAHDLDSNTQGGAARYAEFAADGLERVAETLRNKDPNGMLREVESFARRQPVVFFGAAIATGFLAVRFLKSSSPADPGRDGESAAKFAPNR